MKFKATSHNKAKTMMLYNGNLKISQAFYPLLGVLEVILRNRIFHNEPICFVNNKIDFSYARNIYASITYILAWIDPKIHTSLLKIDRVLKVIDDEEKKQNTP